MSLPAGPRLLALVVSSLVVLATGQAGATSTLGDFNADGYDDLAIGIPFEDVGALTDAGAVQVLYGSSGGLSATAVPDQLWTQDSPNVEDVAEAGDRFGNALARGDFNADGYADLAIGAPIENVGGVVMAGAVHVLYGSYLGLAVPRDGVFPDPLFHADQLFTEDTPGLEGVAEQSDHFGTQLTVGDFDGDGVDDLAVGAPYELSGTSHWGGAAFVIYGSTFGLTVTGNQVWTQDSPDVEDTAEADDYLGSALAAGDFNGDGDADLAIGVPNESVGALTQAGAVNVVYGSVAGLSDAVAAPQIWHQNSFGIDDTAELNDYFSSALGAGDFNGDGFGDLVVGVGHEDLAVTNAGTVHVIHGASVQVGLTATAIPDQLWHQDVAGVDDTSESFDHWGYIVPSR